MARRRVRLKSGGVEELLKSAGVRDELTRHAEQVAVAARASAPVDTGAYRDSIRVEQATTDRAVVRVVAGVSYAMAIEAGTGNMARAADAAGGT